jgi:hypothetical protein
MLKEGMKIEARHVRRKQLSQYIDISHIKKERKVSETTQKDSSIQIAKKRVSAEMSNSLLSKKTKLTDESVSTKENQIPFTFHRQTKYNYYNINNNNNVTQVRYRNLNEYYKYSENQSSIQSFYRRTNRKLPNGKVFYK